MTTFLKRISLILCLTAMPVFAADAGGTLRIAVVDLARLIDESPYAQVIGESLRQEFAPIERELTALQQELQAMDTRMTEQGEFMSEVERYELERDMARLSRNLQRRNAEYQEDVNIRRNDELGRLQAIAVQAVRDYADQEGFDLVLADGIVYASERTDITAPVMALIQERFRASTDGSGG